MTNPPFELHAAADRLRSDASTCMPGSWDETWRVACATSWDECASRMELEGAREVPFIMSRGMPEAPETIVVNGAGHGDLLWTALLAAAREYMREDLRGPAF